MCTRFSSFLRSLLIISEGSGEELVEGGGVEGDLLRSLLSATLDFFCVEIPNTVLESSLSGSDLAAVMELRGLRRSGQELEMLKVGFAVLLREGGQAEDSIRFLWVEFSSRSKSSMRSPFRAICMVLVLSVGLS